MFNVFDNDLFIVLGAILLVILINLIPRTERVCEIFDGSGTPFARFSRVLNFKLKYYRAKCENKVYLFYTHSHSHYKHISIYLNDEQVAQIDKDLHVEDNKDTYTLYLLDADETTADLFAMFILYYDNYNHTSRSSVSIGKSWNWAWTIGTASRFYSKEWLTVNFGKKAD